jgi:hypothetical protein
LEQNEVFSFVLRAVEGMGLPYMVVGSVASISYGEPRMTLDMDLVIEIAVTDVGRFCAAFPQDEFYMSPHAVVEAIIHRGQFNVIHPESGNKIDFMLPKTDPWSRQQIQGRRPRPILNGADAFVARPEDVIISKMLYYREGASDKHLRDIAGMLKISGELIDREYVARWASELKVMDVWQAILKRVGLI